MYKKEAFARLFSIFSCQHIKDPDLYTPVHPLHLGAKPLLAEVRAKHRAVCQKPRHGIKMGILPVHRLQIPVIFHIQLTVIAFRILSLEHVFRVGFIFAISHPHFLWYGMILGQSISFQEQYLRV